MGPLRACGKAERAVVVTEAEQEEVVSPQEDVRVEVGRNESADAVRSEENSGEAAEDLLSRSNLGDNTLGDRHPVLGRPSTLTLLMRRADEVCERETNAALVRPGEQG